MRLCECDSCGCSGTRRAQLGLSALWFVGVVNRGVEIDLLTAMLYNDLHFVETLIWRSVNGKVSVLNGRSIWTKRVEMKGVSFQGEQRASVNRQAVTLIVTHTYCIYLASATVSHDSIAPSCDPHAN